MSRHPRTRIAAARLVASSTARSADASDVSEKELERQVRELAAMLGWRRFHVYRSRRSEPGWPDEALVRDRLVLLELKSPTGKLSEAQKDWLRALLAAGVEVYVIRPDDLQDLATVLAAKAGQAAGARSALLFRLEAELG